MNIKRLFCVLFISLMLLSVPCVYATDDSSENNNVNKVNSSPINPVMKYVIMKTEVIVGKCSPNSIGSTGNELQNSTPRFIELDPKFKKIFERHGKLNINPDSRVGKFIRRFGRSTN